MYSSLTNTRITIDSMAGNKQVDLVGTNMTAPDSIPSLAWAHPLVQEWFFRRFVSPTEPQEQGWPPILGGGSTLICAPTGSGKTLAAFLVSIDRLIRKALSG